ncbi:MAG TPA: hypothetical protein VG347_23765 [Verrucomicrobiae bacterium]|nr:hypothetical protein [Verrucomicrobiae bacterium]
MTAEQLIAEGRKLQRPCYFLRPEVSGEIAAIWHERDDDEIDETGHQCWLTIDARFIPGLHPSVKGFISVFSNEEDCQSGRVEVADSWPERKGVKLYAHPALVLPPLDAVIARGSDAVGDWLRANDWRRADRFNGNFADEESTKAYNEVWRSEYPIYFDSDIYAVLGGWHWPGQDNDWHDLIDEHLMVLTIRDSEPWVEAWRTRSGDFKVIQRIT